MSFEQTKYILKLEIPISVGTLEYDKTYLNQITKLALTNINSLTNDGYEDGRHPFYREMFELALSKLLKDVAQDSIRNVIANKIGENHTTQIENGFYNTAYNEAGKLAAKLSVHVEHSDWKASVDTVNYYYTEK